MSDAPKWYMAIGGHQVGPVSAEEIIANIQNGTIDGSTLVFLAGMESWTPIREVPRFQTFLNRDRGAAAIPSAPGRRAHDISFKIVGNEMQYVEVELDPGEAVVAEAGAMMYMTRGIELDTIFGDGSSSGPTGVMDALLGAGKRLLTGESLFMTVFTNRSSAIERVSFAAPYAGKIIPMDLAAMGGELICQKDSFLCAARGVSIGIAFQRKIGAGLFGGEGFIMQRLTGDGLTFVHSGGTVNAFDLAAGEGLRVDTGCLVALQPSVTYDIEYVGKIKTVLFGGEGLFYASLTGPGRVWLQSLPFSRLADRIYSSASRLGGHRKEEGGLLSGLDIGGILGGR